MGGASKNKKIRDRVDSEGKYEKMEAPDNGLLLKPFLPQIFPGSRNKKSHSSFLQKRNLFSK